MLSGSRASDTPGQAPLRPQRRPPRPRHPVVGVCYRGGLRLGRRCPEARPHRHQTGGVALHEDPCMSCLPMTAPPNGGNCTIRGATRRRHADRTLLMLQNPPSSPGYGGVAEVNCVPESPASQNIWAITPMPAIVRRGGLHCGRHIPANRDLTTPNSDLTTPNSDLTTPNRGLTTTKRGELHH